VLSRGAATDMVCCVFGMCATEQRIEGVFHLLSSFILMDFGAGRWALMDATE
jgi:hypothetical protein